MEKSKNRINEIIKVVGEYEDRAIPFQLSFNIIDINNNHFSFTVGINNDAETIFFDVFNSWRNIDNMNLNLYYGKIIIVQQSDELYKLIDQDIEKILIGKKISETKGSMNTIIKNELLYYFKMETKSYNFLYYNAGDYGRYSFDNIDEILKNDINYCKWEIFPFSSSFS